MASSTNPKARILTASAGSGKTYSLAYQYIYNVLRNQPEEKGGGFNPYAYRAILAVTFTNKATEEMKSRILRQIHNLATANKCEFAEDLVKQTGLTIEQLQERAMAVRSAILHDYSRFAILTNDTFFQRIVRAFVKELGIEINYAIELDTAPVVQKSADNLIETMNSNPDLQEWLLGLAEENISQGKQWDIKRAILQLKGELFKEQTKEAIESVKDKAALRKMIFDYLEAAEREMEQIKDVAREALKFINGIIEENDLNLAKNICKIIKNPDIRNRAVANVLAADIAEKYFTEIEVDTESGIVTTTDTTVRNLDRIHQRTR